MKFCWIVSHKSIYFRKLMYLIIDKVIPGWKGFWRFKLPFHQRKCYVCSRNDNYVSMIYLPKYFYSSRADPENFQRRGWDWSFYLSAYERDSGQRPKNDKNLPFLWPAMEYSVAHFHHSVTIEFSFIISAIDIWYMDCSLKKLDLLTSMSTLRKV